jgi:hypothetical protein
MAWSGAGAAFLVEKCPASSELSPDNPDFKVSVKDEVFAVVSARLCVPHINVGISVGKC